MQCLWGWPTIRAKSAHFTTASAARHDLAVGQLCTVRYIVWGTLIPFCVTLIW
jgi:hypothetical protein